MPEIPLKNNAVREISKENDLTMLSLQKIKFYDFMNIYISFLIVTIIYYIVKR